MSAQRIGNDPALAAVTIEIDDSPESLQHVLAALPEGLNARLADACPAGFTWLELTANDDRRLDFAGLARAMIVLLGRQPERCKAFRVVNGGMWIDLGVAKEPADPPAR